MSTEQRKAQYRADYYKNLESNREKSRLRAAAKRASKVETEEQKAERLAYHKKWYEDHKEEVLTGNKDRRAKQKESELPDLSKMSPGQQHQLKMIVISMLAKKESDRLEHRRQWNYSRHGGGPRKPAALKPVKVPRILLTPEEKRERQAAYNRKKLRDAKSDPVRLAMLRAKKNTIAKRWIENMRINEPEKYAKYRKGQTDYERRHRSENWHRKMSCVIRTQIANSLRGLTKYGALEVLLGCSMSKLVTHLQSQFIEGMTWENFGKGKGKWGIDHIKPIAAHNLAIFEDQQKAFHYSNLRPMWHEENSSKGSMYDGRRWRHTDHPLQ